jgi:hypothetical protein
MYADHSSWLCPERHLLDFFNTIAPITRWGNSLSGAETVGADSELRVINLWQEPLRGTTYYIGLRT